MKKFPLAQQWFFSLVGKSTSARFSKICEIVKSRSYERVKQDIIVYSSKMNDMRNNYSNKLKSIKAKTKEIKNKYLKAKKKQVPVKRKNKA